MNESFTAAIVVRSLWAALGVVWVTGVLVGWVVGRLVVCWPVSWDVVVAVDIGTWNLLGESVEGPATETADRLVATQAWKSPWLVTVFGCWEARLVTEATVEPPAIVSRNQVAKIPDGRRRTGRRASIGLLDGAARGTPYTHRRKKKRKNYRRECTGSALAPM